jgi:hypothetical protein
MAITIDVAIGVTDAYCTLAEADSYLADYSTWNNSTDEQKTEALLSSRYYLDITYSCDLSTTTTIPDELKFANAILANDFIADPTIFDNGPTVIQERVKADTVESETKYSDIGNKNTPTKLRMVDGILQALCTRQRSSVWLTRA